MQLRVALFFVPAAHYCFAVPYLQGCLKDNLKLFKDFLRVWYLNRPMVSCSRSCTAKLSFGYVYQDNVVGCGKSRLEKEENSHMMRQQ